MFICLQRGVKMVIYYDWINDRIGAIYTNCKTSSTKWIDLNYGLYWEKQPFMKPMQKPTKNDIPNKIIGKDGKIYHIDKGAIVEATK